jgi:hypothetical protein
MPPKHGTSLPDYTASHPRGRFIVTIVRTSNFTIVVIAYGNFSRYTWLLFMKSTFEIQSIGGKRVYFAYQIGCLQVSLFNNPFLRPVVLGMEVFHGQSTRILKFYHHANKIHYTSSFMNTAVTLMLIVSATVIVQPFLRKRIFELKI